MYAKQKMRFKIGIFLSCMISSLCFANTICPTESQIEQVLKQKHLSLHFDSNYLSCKVLPNNPNQVVIAYAEEIDTEQDQEPSDFQLTFLTLDATTLRVLDIYPVKNRLVSDAVELESIALDMANYAISENKNLVGIRANYMGRSQPNPYSTTSLNLYDLQNKKQLLDGLVVKQYTAETDTRCNANIEKRNSVLIMQKNKTNQYFDIKVQSKIDQYKMSGTSEDCKESKHHYSQQSFLLKYSDAHYQIPKNFKDKYQY